MRALLLAGLILTAALTACDGDDGTPDPESTPTPAPAVLIKRGDADGGEVALTFELSEGTDEAEHIVAALAERNVRVTFAITGRWAEANTGLLNAIAAGGHQIINLTYDGSSFTGASTGTAPLDGDERALALSRTETTIFRNTSRSTRPFMRPPHGDVDSSVLRDAGASGYGYAVLWSIDARATPSVATEATAGGVIALDAASPATVAALPEVIDVLRARGLAFATVAELVSEQRTTLASAGSSRRACAA